MYRIIFCLLLSTSLLAQTPSHVSSFTADGIFEITKIDCKKPCNLSTETFLFPVYIEIQADNTFIGPTIIEAYLLQFLRKNLQNKIAGINTSGAIKILGIKDEYNGPDLTDMNLRSLNISEVILTNELKLDKSDKKFLVFTIIASFGAFKTNRAPLELSTYEINKIERMLNIDVNDTSISNELGLKGVIGGSIALYLDKLIITTYGSYLSANTQNPFTRSSSDTSHYHDVTRSNLGLEVEYQIYDGKLGALSLYTGIDYADYGHGVKTLTREQDKPLVISRNNEQQVLVLTGLRYYFTPKSIRRRKK